MASTSKTPKQYVAKVIVTTFVDGQRVDIQAGDPVPELNPHDEAQLLRMGAIEELGAVSDAERQALQDQRAGDKAFQAERDAVIAANASTAPAVDGSASGSKKAAGKA